MRRKSKGSASPRLRLGSPIVMYYLRGSLFVRFNIFCISSTQSTHLFCKIYLAHFTRYCSKTFALTHSAPSLFPSQNSAIKKLSSFIFTTQKSQLPSSAAVRKKLHGFMFFCHNPRVYTDSVT